MSGRDEQDEERTRRFYDAMKSLGVDSFDLGPPIQVFVPEEDAPMTPEKRELLRQFIDAVEKLAFEMPAPNAYTPRFVQMCQEARSLLTRPKAQGETPRTDAEAVEVTWRAKDALCEDWAEAVNADFARQLERELSAKREGFVWVPREPTEDMLRAAQRYGGWRADRWKEVYAAMIAAVTKEGEMDKYVTLIGAEKIEHAARSMQDAAESIRQSIGYLDDILQRDRIARDEWLTRFEQAIERLQPKEPHQ